MSLNWISYDVYDVLGNESNTLGIKVEQYRKKRKGKKANYEEL